MPDDPPARVTFTDVLAQLTLTALPRRRLRRRPGPIRTPAADPDRSEHSDEHRHHERGAQRDHQGTASS